MAIPGMRSGWTLAEWQAHLAKLYGKQNLQRRPLETLSRLVEMASGLARGVRDDNEQIMEVFAPRTLAWLLGVANQLGVDLEDVSWKAYPGVCTHCHQNEVCVCRLKPENRTRVTEADGAGAGAASTRAAKPQDLLEWQAMFKRIYFRANKAVGANQCVLHFLEELGEVSEAIRFTIAPDSPVAKEVADRRVGNELADLFAWFCGLVNLKNLEVDHFMKRIYGETCPECLQNPCECHPYHVHNQIRLGGKE